MLGQGALAPNIVEEVIVVLEMRKCEVFVLVNAAHDLLETHRLIS